MINVNKKGIELLYIHRMDSKILLIHSGTCVHLQNIVGERSITQKKKTYK